MEGDGATIIIAVTHAAPLSISGSLVAVGGRDDNCKAVNTLHLYQPAAGQWVKVADTLTTLVTGGPHQKKVDITRIC